MRHPPLPPSWRQSLVGQCEGRPLFAGEQGVFFCCGRPFGCLASKVAICAPGQETPDAHGAHSSWASHPIPFPIPLEARAAHPLAPTQASLAKSSPPLEHHRSNNNIRPWNTRRIQSVIHSSPALSSEPHDQRRLTRALLYFTTGTSAVSVPFRRDFSDCLGLDLGLPRLQHDSGPALTSRFTPSLLYGLIHKPLGFIPTKATSSEAKCISQPFSPRSSCR